MADAVGQSYERHSRYVPGFHFITSGLLIVNLVWRLIQTFRLFSFGAVADLLVAVALCLLFFYIRQFPLSVQDRLIRLEERTRIERLCPDLVRRLDEFTPRQLIALRFAGDQELPALARRALDEHITDQKVLKKAIRDWRADHMRA